MAIKVHGSACFVNPGRVLVTLFEKNVEDFESFDVDLFTGEPLNRTPEFLKNQPFGLTPYIVDGDLTLFESRAIARYIENKFADQGTRLYGSSAKDRALTEQWLEVEGQNYQKPSFSIIFNVCFAHLWGLKCDDAVVAAETAKLEAVLDIYEKRLSETKYLAGDFFSLADLSHIPNTWFLMNLAHKSAIYDSRPHVQAWAADIFGRPSTKRWLKLANFGSQRWLKLANLAH